MKYYCDESRHVVCVPYSIENLHIMGKKLKLKRHWYHKSKGGLGHYDMPYSYIKFLLDTITGINFNTVLVDYLTAILFILALFLSTTMNILDYRKKE